MAALNEALNFDTAADPSVRGAFTRGTPESKELLPSGTKLI